MDQKNQKIIIKKLHDLIGEKFGNYSRYIIQDRALPNINDGLKPVQRRILFAMYKLKLFQKNPYKKSARVVGDVIGKYHPHGDTSVYEAMIRMAQEWKMSLPLVDMHGNKGSIDGDSAAAMRYTEARLHEITNHLIGDIEKKIIKFQPNFDDTELEPTVFPALFPNLLINGSTGIASGYSTNIPPHNFNEVLNALIYILKNDDASLNDIVKIIKGPDFPTGGIIETKKDIQKSYQNGHGKILIKAKINYDEARNALIITEIPFEVNKANLVKKIDDLINSTSVSTIKEVIDETDRNGIQIAILLKPKVNHNSVINFLFRKTDLQKTYSINFIAIKEKSPLQFSLIEFFHSFAHFTRNNYRSLFKYELEKVLYRLEVVEGIIRAIPIIDEIIVLIRASKNKADAREKLIAKYAFSEIQAEAILNLKLYRLSNTDIVEFETEKSELEQARDHYQKGLKNANYLNQIIIETLEKLNTEFVFPRKTRIKASISDTQQFDVKDLIREEEVDVSITKKGLIKVMEPDAKGVSKVALDDLIIFDKKNIKNFRTLGIFTSYGRYYAIELFKIPTCKPRETGIKFNTFFSLAPDEQIVNVVFLNEDDLKTDNTLLIATKNSLIKKINYSLLPLSTTKAGIKTIKLAKDDKVVSYANVTDDNGIVNAVTNKGLILRYPISHISPSTLASQGVTNVKLQDDDAFVGLVLQDSKSIVSGSDSLIFATRMGIVKRLSLSVVRETSRAKKGQKISFEDDLNIIAIFNYRKENLYYLDDSYKRHEFAKDQVPLNKKTTSKNALDLGIKIIDITDQNYLVLKKVAAKKELTKKAKEKGDFFNF